MLTVPNFVQPTGESEINAGSTLASGLKLAGYKNAWLKDLAAGDLWTNNGGAGTGYMQSGPGWSFDATATYLSRADDVVGISSKVFSFMCVVKPTTTLLQDRRFFSFGDTSNTNYIVSLGTGYATGGFLETSAVLFIRDASTAVGSGCQVANEFERGKQSVCIGVVSADGNAYLYTQNGSASFAKSGQPFAWSANRTALGCLLRSTASSFCGSDVSMWGAWNRELTRQEVQMLLVNPWQLFRSKKTVPILDLAAGGSTTTLMGQAWM